MKIRKKHYIKIIFENLLFIFAASMARRRFWIINFLFPKSPDKLTLKQAIEESFENDKKILDLGCGDRAQSLRDLRNYGYKNLIGIDLHPPKKITGVELKKANILDTGFDNESIDGVIYAAYVLPHLSLEDQFKASEEIDRIAAKGCRGFVGPFNPQVIKTNSIFPEYKNPYFGYIQAKNKIDGQRWELRRSILPNFATYSKPNSIQSLIYRIPIPLYVAYFLSGRVIINKLTPNILVKKDFKERFPFEYFITFKK